jgi:hypothetical protein
MNASRPLFLGSLLAAASWQALACYTVYDGSNRAVYRSAEAPVDMSRPIHETLPQRFPGGQLVFDTAASCSELTTVARPLPPERPSPVLTDRKTAQAMQVPYTVVAGDVVMVRPGVATMRPTVTTVPALAQARPQPRRTETVITELRNPPVTIIENGDGMTVSALAR